MTTPASAYSPPETAGGAAQAGDRSRAAVEMLHATSAAVVREPDRRELARTLTREIALALRAQDAIVATIEDDMVVSHARYAAGVVSESPLGEATRAVLEWVAQRRQAWHSNHADDLVPCLAAPLSSLGWRSVAMVPALHHQGHVIAVILVANRAGPAGFPGLDVRILETIAQQAAVGFDRGLLLDQLGEWTRGMEALLAFSASVNRQREPAALINEMVEHSARFLKADGGRAGLRQLDASTGASVMVSEQRWLDGRWHVEPRVWARHEGLPGTLLESEFPMLVPDYAAERMADADLRARGVVGSLVCVPMKDSSGAVLGFLELHRRVGRPPLSWHDIAFVESLASTTAVSIENARLVSALAVKTDEIRALSAHHVTSLETERQHIARELHDEAGQALVGVKLSLQALAAAIPATEPTLREALDEVRLQVNDATSRLRELARRLRPPTLDQLGLQSALQQLAHESEHRSGVRVVLDAGFLPSRLAPTLETALFRITQEALTNVSRHAQARQVDITLGRCDARVWLRVADDGVGFQPDAVTSGLGLLGIRERVLMLGGDTTVRSAPGAGTELIVEVPES